MGRKIDTYWAEQFSSARPSEHLVGARAARDPVLAVRANRFARRSLAWGLLATLYQWERLTWENRAVGTVLVLYFLLSWQFVQTFPRLDQWLSFWMALTAVRAQATNRVGEPGGP